MLLHSFEWAFKLHLSCRTFSTFGALCVRGRYDKMLKDLDFTGDDLGKEDFEDVDALIDTDANSLQHKFDMSRQNIDRINRNIVMKTIEHKYFKHLKPVEENLLTWAMKEQLHFLHSSDPAMWTPEALALAFPTTVEGAKKLIESKWAPADEMAAARHDRAVIAKWRRLTNGTLGSVRLLEKKVEMRIKEHAKLSTGAEVVCLADRDELMSTLKSLRFHYEDEEPFVPKNVKGRPNAKKPPKVPGGSFASIIRDYEKDLKAMAGTEPEMPVPSECKDLSLVLPEPLKYEGLRTRIQNEREKRKKNYRKYNKIVTLDEFMSQKMKKG